ncbi:MAG: rod shape-determining protein [Eubacterium sp.]|jgi:rod shape-determining protein MreB|nr:rod shape-determining protein [Eubacterium sp.]
MASLDIGIDLGTANSIITLSGKGIVINEPSVVAYDRKKGLVVAIGDEAYQMLGRTPEYIVAIRPLKDGVISDNTMVGVMIKEFIKKVNHNALVKPRVIVCVPSLVTDIESRALVEAAISAGARKVCLIEEPIAALIGAGVDISKPNGTMVVDIGGGTADIAVISFNGIVESTSIKMAGNRLDAAIIKYIQYKHKVLIGEKTAENAKIKLADVFKPIGRTIEVKGRHLLKGLPEKITITDFELKEALEDPINEVIGKIKEIFERTPPELSGDILSNGIILTGGGGLLGGLDKLISAKVGAPCYVAENAIESVARGIEKAFKFSDELLDGFREISLYRYR